MMIRLQSQRVEAGRLLEWLDGLLKKGDAVNVEILIDDGPDRSSSVRITLRGVPSPLAGLPIRPSRGG